ncbi:uncharacterized protein PG986_000675 [Apiospora aurea]|uniref:Ankyrin repeat protein n=1 Tax=Apiospora aurea TaxID=335848 RepID=A0ABR1QUS4_9PEZI
MAERKTGTSPSPRTEGADTKLQGGAFSPPYHDLADPTECPFEALPVETVLLIAQYCGSAQNQARLAQASKWLNVIVSPVVYETVCADSEWILPEWVADIAATPLVHAINVGNYDIAKFLLQHGAAVELRENCAGRPVEVTLLHLLATATPSKETCQIMEMLVQRKYVPVDATDAGGLTPLARAAAMGGGDPVLETLKALGADVNYVIPAGNFAPSKSILEAFFEADLDYSWMTAKRVRAARRFIELSGEAGDKDHQRSLLNQCRKELLRPGYEKLKVLEEFIEYLETRL